MNKNSKVTGKVAKKTARVLGRRKSLTFRKGAFGQVGRVANTDTAAKELYLLNEGSSQTLGGPYSEGYLKETSQKNQTESLDLDKFQSKPTLSTQTSRYGNSYTRQSSLQERQSQFSFFKSNPSYRDSSHTYSTNSIEYAMSDIIPAEVNKSTTDIMEKDGDGNQKDTQLSNTTLHKSFEKDEMGFEECNLRTLLFDNDSAEFFTKDIKQLNDDPQTHLFRSGSIPDKLSPTSSFFDLNRLEDSLEELALSPDNSERICSRDKIRTSVSADYSYEINEDSLRMFMYDRNSDTMSFESSIEVAEATKHVFSSEIEKVDAYAYKDDDEEISLRMLIYD